VKARTGPPPTLWLIAAVALALRLLGAWRGNLTFDESAHLALADTISFDPDRFHLVFRTLDHPLLSIYVFKLSGMLLGDSNFGLRILHVLFGAATVVPVFLLGREVFSERAGLWAAGLLAVDQFHASWSRLFMPEVPMLFFWSLALLQLVRLTGAPSRRDFVLLGVWFGLAYLAKETALLLLPVAWSFAVLCRRNFLLDARWYLAHVVFLILIAPDLVWNALHFSESYLHRDAEMLAQPFRIQFKSLSLYLGEMIRLVNERALDLDYDQGNAYSCHWPAGLLYLIGIAAALDARTITGRDPKAALLLIGFAVPFVAFTLLPGGELFDPFWWASPSLISGIVFAGGLLDRATRRSVVLKALGVFFIAYLSVHFVPLAWRPGGPGGVGYPRTTVGALASNAILSAREAIAHNEPAAARRDLIYALNVGGPNAAAYYYLGYLHYIAQEYAAAESSLQKSLELEPDNPAAEQLLGQVRSSRLRHGTAE
jgi:4-amino-4-deoxy-L-arabinose transferase-like glycosyltransferase